MSQVPVVGCGGNSLPSTPSCVNPRFAVDSAIIPSCTELETRVVSVNLEEAIEDLPPNPLG